MIQYSNVPTLFLPLEYEETKRNVFYLSRRIEKIFLL
jgi:hypothetical protein